MNTKELNEIKLRYKGKGGGPEAESHVAIEIDRSAFRGIAYAFKVLR